MPELRALTGLRFLAALHVVIFHFGAWEHWPIPAALRGVFSAGHTAVTLFFVLSGFILTYTHLSPGVARIGALEMYTLRFARIYPVYLVGLLFAAPLFFGWHLRNGVTPEAMKTLSTQSAAVLLMVQAYVPQWAMAWNAPAWSISVEMLCYWSFSFIAPRLIACRRTTALWIGVAAWASSLLAPLAFAILRPGVVDDEDSWRRLVLYFPLLRLPDFIVGIVAARLYIESPERRGHADLTILSALALAAAIIDAGFIPDILWRTGMLSPLFAVLIVSLARGGGFVARLLGTRALGLLGQSSYALYIIHEPIRVWLLLIGYGITKRDLRGDTPLMLYSVPALILASIAVFKWIEAPARGVLKRLLIPRVRALPRAERASSP